MSSAYLQSFLKNIDSSNKILLNEITRSSHNWDYSFVNRFPTMEILTYYNSFHLVNTVTIVYSVNIDSKFGTPRELETLRRNPGESEDKQTTISAPPKSAGSQSVIFALAYATVGNKKDMYFNKENLVVNSKRIFINSVCNSGSLISRDGEYRSTIIDWNNYLHIIKKDKELLKLIQDIKNYLEKTFENYISTMEVYFPNVELKNKYSMEIDLISDEISFELFAMAWFNFYTKYILGTVNNHINENFKKLMIRDNKNNITFFRSTVKKYGIEVIYKYRYICNNYIAEPTHSVNLGLKTKLGQKIIPLNLGEAQNHFNLEHSPWKEYMILNKVSNLVVNNITNGFPLCCVLFFIKCHNEFLFDNPSQSDKLIKSNLGIKITNMLQKAKLYTRGNINLDMKPENEIYITSWLSGEFLKLYEKINDSINHSKENIIMSNVAINIITEYVGKTLYDSIYFITTSKYYRNFTSHIFGKKSHDLFKKYMFQLCYNLLCLNTHLHIIHGDLHLNNITINSSFYTKSREIKIKHPKILYCLDENNSYIFDHNFYDLCIIDFSRSIIHPDYYKDLELEEYSDISNIIYSKNSFTNKQLNNLIEYLIAIKVEFMEFREYLKNMIQYNYDVVFKLLTVLDLYTVTQKLIQFIKTFQTRMSIYPASQNLIVQLNKSCEKYIEIIYKDMLNPNQVSQVKVKEWPLAEIIIDTFTNNLSTEFTLEDYKNIVDVYDYSQKLKHSLETPAKYPDFLTKKSFMSSQSKINFLKQKRKNFDKDKTERLEVLNIIMKRHCEKIMY
jgi:hypothetical protein